jgi:hypothetical protein
MRRHLIVLLFLILIGACSTTRIVETPPIHPPNGVTKSQVESAIKAAVSRFKGAWAIEEIQQDTIIAGLRVRNHYMKLGIYYNERTISSRIISSINLKQDDRSIHKRALFWQTRLETAIHQEVARLSISSRSDLNITKNAVSVIQSEVVHEIIKSR